MNVYIKILVIIFTFIYCWTAFAEEKTINVKVDYIVTNTNELEKWTNLARNQARLIASEQFGSYIKSETEVNLNTVSKDQLNALSSITVKYEKNSEKIEYKCINKENNILRVLYQARYKGDTEKFLKKVILLKNKDKNCIKDITAAIEVLNKNIIEDTKRQDEIKRYLNNYYQDKMVNSLKVLEKLDDSVKMNILDELGTEAYNKENYVLAAICFEKESSLTRKYHTSNEHIILARTGYSYKSQYDYQNAKKYLELALKIKPRFYWAASGLGDIYMEEHDFKNALRCFAIAVDDYDKKPYLATDNMNLACAYFVNNQTESALVQLNEAKKNLRYVLTEKEKNKLGAQIDEFERIIKWFITQKNNIGIDITAIRLSSYQPLAKNTCIDYFIFDTSDGREEGLCDMTHLISNPYSYNSMNLWFSRTKEEYVYGDGSITIY